MHEHRQNRAMVGSVSPSFGRTQITPRSVRRHPPVAAYGPPQIESLPVAVVSSNGVVCLIRPIAAGRRMLGRAAGEGSLA